MIRLVKHKSEGIGKVYAGELVERVTQEVGLERGITLRIDKLTPFEPFPERRGGRVFVRPAGKLSAMGKRL